MTVNTAVLVIICRTRVIILGEYYYFQFIPAISGTPKKERKKGTR